MKKLLYLFLALLLPGLIFVFLKYAGKNEFTIPVYFEEGVNPPPADCRLKYDKPYRLPDSVWHLTTKDHPTANVLVFSKDGLNFSKLKSAIDDEFGSGAVWMEEAHTWVQDSLAYSKWRKCIFLITDPWQAALFDDQGRIRGYYDPRLREEQDRLRVELKILLKKY